MRQVIYISGKISAPTATEIARNIHRFDKLERWLIINGFAPLNPASDFQAVGMGGIDYEMLMDKDEALIKRAADALFLLSGWETSVGANKERAWAIECNIPIVHSIEELKDLFSA